MLTVGAWEKAYGRGLEGGLLGGFRGFGGKTDHRYLETDLFKGFQAKKLEIEPSFIKNWVRCGWTSRWGLGF